ncbi:sulfatase [Carboxylicivirga sediminis]|uniref:Sulfatase n=1 Tax=Carboxylicivirga sediminis TaxID=2006564 RepID=A0A941F4P3_9BACT|nr:sulfatase [Carboxylicivirga sediminis]MBR8535160.1 sulfatase [Carboxylicivirga sediminis]
MQLKTFVVLASLLVLTTFKSYSAIKPKSASKPNILLILVDDLGWQDVSYRGSNYFETKHIDRLAETGVMFNNAYAPAANCAPSRACIISGQNTPRHSIYTVGSSERGKSINRKLIPVVNNTVLADSVVTIAEKLKSAGYTTASMGKWHLGEDPCSQGFDVNIGGSHAGHPKSYFSPYKNAALKDGPDGEYLTDRLTSEAIDFIKSSAAESEQPFFLYLPYYTVHTPLQAKDKLIKKYEQKPGCKGRNHAVYGAMVESMDDNVGRLLACLDDCGISENTLVVFFSDNGGIANISSQYPARAGKGSYYEGGIREPLIMRWPSGFPSGKVIDQQVSGLDFYPTFMAIAGVKPDTKQILDGVSLVKLITKNKRLKRKALFFHFPIYLQAINPETDQARDPHFRTTPGSVVIKGDWKLHVYYEDNEMELYNLKDDPGESTNLVNTYPEVAKALNKQLVDWLNETDAHVPTIHNPEYQKK